MVSPTPWAHSGRDAVSHGWRRGLVHVAVSHGFGDVHTGYCGRVRELAGDHEGRPYRCRGMIAEPHKRESRRDVWILAQGFNPEEEGF